MQRPRLKNIAGERFDLVIIGGGVTGCAAARDAALRGLRVALFEKHDFAGGTSSRSTKLVHGGLRYLENREFKLVKEAVREREILTRTAPHLVRPFQFLYPVYRGDNPGLLKLRLGLWLYDRYAGTPAARRTRILGRAGVRGEEPALRTKNLVGGGIFYDAQTDDARLTLEMALDAATAGAQLMNHARVDQFVFKGDRISGVIVEDLLSGEKEIIRARRVANATGVWSDQVRRLDRRDSEQRLRPTKGVHIVFRREEVPLSHAVYVRHPRDHRAVFLIPRGEIVYVGTTDTDFDGSPDGVYASQTDVAYLVEATNHTIPGHGLTLESVQAAWAGLRPLVRPSGAVSPSAVSREHEIFTAPNGLISIAGGKLTTSRVMGAELVDTVVRSLKEEGFPGMGESHTETRPLPGGDYTGSLDELMAKIQKTYLLDPAVARRLVDRYGSRAYHIAEMTDEDPTLREVFPGDVGPVTKAEVRYSVEAEMTRTLADFLDRRTGFLPLTRDAGLSIVEPLGRFMGELLGWSAEERQRQVREYRDLVRMTRSYQRELESPTEATAD